MFLVVGDDGVSTTFYCGSQDVPISVVIFHRVD
jgi:hypothetical protein